MQLQAATSDRQREQLVVQFSLSQLDSDAKNAVRIIAIPNFFNMTFLSSLISDNTIDIQDLFSKITKLSFIQKYQDDDYIVHIHTRNLIREQIWKEDPTFYESITESAIKFCFESSINDIRWYLEGIYHSLILGSTDAVDKLKLQLEEWLSTHEYAQVENFLRILMSAVEAGRLVGRGAAWIYYYQGQIHAKYNRFVEAEQSFTLALNQQSNDNILLFSTVTALDRLHVKNDFLYDNSSSLTNQKHYNRIEDKIYMRAVFTIDLRPSSSNLNSSSSNLNLSSSDQTIFPSSYDIASWLRTFGWEPLQMRVLEETNKSTDKSVLYSKLAGSLLSQVQDVTSIEMSNIIYYGYMADSRTSFVVSRIVEGQITFRIFHPSLSTLLLSTEIIVGRLFETRMKGYIVNINRQSVYVFESGYDNMLVKGRIISHPFAELFNTNRANALLFAISIIAFIILYFSRFFLNDILVVGFIDLLSTLITAFIVTAFIEALNIIRSYSKIRSRGLVEWDFNNSLVSA